MAVVIISRRWKVLGLFEIACQEFFVQRTMRIGHLRPEVSPCYNCNRFFECCSAHIDLVGSVKMPVGYIFSEMHNHLPLRDVDSTQRNLCTYLLKSYCILCDVIFSQGGLEQQQRLFNSSLGRDDIAEYAVRLQ